MEYLKNLIKLQDQDFKKLKNSDQSRNLNNENKKKNIEKLKEVKEIKDKVYKPQPKSKLKFDPKLAKQIKINNQRMRMKRIKSMVKLTFIRKDKIKSEIKRSKSAEGTRKARKPIRKKNDRVKETPGDIISLSIVPENNGN